MFDRNVLIHGKHAKYIKDLATPFKSANEHNKNVKLFDRYLDVYIAGAIVGISFGLTATVDKDSEYANITANIMYDQIAGEKDILEYIYRTIMLIDTTNPDYQSVEKLVNRAFKEDSSDLLEEKHKINQGLFLSYVLGGVEYLHENIFDTNIDEAIHKLYEFYDGWNTRFYLSSQELELKEYC